MVYNMVFTKSRSSKDILWLSPELSNSLKSALVDTGVYPGTQVNVKEYNNSLNLEVTFTNSNKSMLEKIKSDFTDSNSSLYAVTQYELANNIISTYGDPTIKS